MDFDNAFFTTGEVMELIESFGPRIVETRNEEHTGGGKEGEEDGGKESEA